MVTKEIFFESHNYKARPCLFVSINLALLLLFHISSHLIIKFHFSCKIATIQSGICVNITEFVAMTTKIKKYHTLRSLAFTTRNIYQLDGLFISVYVIMQL